MSWQRNILFEIGYKVELPRDSRLRERYREDGIYNKIRTLRAPGHAYGAKKRFSHFQGSHKLNVLRHHQRLHGCIS